MQTRLQRFGVKPPSADYTFVLDYSSMTAALHKDLLTNEVLFVRRVKCEHLGTVSLFTKGSPGSTWSPKISNRRFAPSIPLLKSHIQKCCRRMDAAWAVEGVMLLLALDPISLYRRLMIIMIEDVALMDGSATVVWLVLAGTSSPIYKKTVDFIVSFMSSLCSCHKTFVSTLAKQDHVFEPQAVLVKHGSHIGSTILSLIMRGSFGGMKGDMLMLARAYSYYVHAPGLIADLRGTVRVTDYNVDCNFCTIPQAYDHHVNRTLPTTISRAVGLSIPDVKRIIWTAESAPNHRKKYTLEERDLAKKTPEYSLVIAELRSRRLKIEANRKA